MSQTIPNPTTATYDTSELTLQIPVWVHGKRKWVTGITKKTTFDDLIFALLVQAELLKGSALSHPSSTDLAGYAIAECLQVAATPTSENHESEPPTSLTQRLLKGRGRVMKTCKNWQFVKFPLTVLHLIPINGTTETNSSTMKLRSKIFRRFLSSKSVAMPTAASLISSSQSDSSLISIGNGSNLTSRQKSFNDFHENLNIIERQKRLLDYLDEKIHQAELNSSPVHTLSKSR